MSDSLSTCILGLKKRMMTIDDRSEKALGKDIIEKLRSLQFCIVGCGGTGAIFAELLVRTGAVNLVLIDGAKVNPTNLNRVFQFIESDCGKYKSEVLRDRLSSIRKGTEISVLTDHFRSPENILPNHNVGQDVRDAVYDADLVFLGTDTNQSRIAIEQMCREKTKGNYLSCGIMVDHQKGVFEFDCAWSPKTPAQRKEDCGYGPENASYASIVHEATSLAFTMLLSHLKDPKSDFKSYLRRYDSNFRPVKTGINEKPSGNTP